MIDKDYYKLIEEARDNQTIHSIELVDETDEYIPTNEINECATLFMDTLEMERAEPEIPVYSMKKELVSTETRREQLHVTADTVITLHDCDGMTEEFLFNQPSHGEWLEEVSNAR
jgi:hypothetical protein